MKNIKVVFISGPFRGKDSWEMECNIRRAEELALKVWKMAEEGYKVCAICPHANTRFFQGAAKDDIWLDGDLAMLAKCDALLTTDDWKRSEGSKAEVEFSKQNNIPVYHSIDELKRELVWKNWVNESLFQKPLTTTHKMRRLILVPELMEYKYAEEVFVEFGKNISCSDVPKFNCCSASPLKNGDLIVKIDKYGHDGFRYIIEDAKLYPIMGNYQFAARLFIIDDLLAGCAEKVFIHRVLPLGNFLSPIEIFIRFGEKVSGKYVDEDFVNCWCNTPVKNGDRIFRKNKWYVIGDVVFSSDSKHYDLYKFKAYPILNTNNEEKVKVYRRLSLGGFSEPTDMFIEVFPGIFPGEDFINCRCKTKVKDGDKIIRTIGNDSRWYVAKYVDSFDFGHEGYCFQAYPCCCLHDDSV